MRFAYDARTLFAGGTGDRTYLANLIPALAHLLTDDELVLYSHAPDAERDALVRDNANVTGALIPETRGWRLRALPRRLRQDKVALLHSQYFLPLRTPCPAIVTIHDITFRLFPHWFPKRARQMLNFFVPLAARSARHIITGSESARQDMIRHFKIAPEKITVTPYAASNLFQPVEEANARTYVAQHYGLQAPYLLGVGVRGQRKNISIVLHAIAELSGQKQWPAGAKLALAGTPDQFPDPIVNELREQVAFLGYVPESDLPALYRAAHACVYPSLYEGFGLPPLEAMACGCPVLSSNTSSLPEVVGDAGYLLPPQELGPWTEAIAHILSDPPHREELREKGLLRARTFSWDHTAQQTAAIYRQVLNG